METLNIRRRYPDRHAWLGLPTGTRCPAMIGSGPVPSASGRSTTSRRMISSEPPALNANREGRLCVRNFQRADDTVATADCPRVESEVLPGVRPRSRFRRVHAFALILEAQSVACFGPGLEPVAPLRPGRDSGR